MVTYIAQKPSFSSMMKYFLGKKLCKTAADFGRISAVAGGLNFGRGPSRSLGKASNHVFRRGTKAHGETGARGGLKFRGFEVMQADGLTTPLKLWVVVPVCGLSSITAYEFIILIYRFSQVHKHVRIFLNMIWNK